MSKRTLLCLWMVTHGNSVEGISISSWRCKSNKRPGLDNHLKADNSLNGGERGGRGSNDILLLQQHGDEAEGKWQKSYQVLFMDQPSGKAVWERRAKKKMLKDEDRRQVGSSSRCLNIGLKSSERQKRHWKVLTLSPLWGNGSERDLEVSWERTVTRAQGQAWPSPPPSRERSTRSRGSQGTPSQRSMFLPPLQPRFVYSELIPSTSPRVS